MKFLIKTLAIVAFSFFIISVAQAQKLPPNSVLTQMLCHKKAAHEIMDVAKTSANVNSITAVIQKNQRAGECAPLPQAIVAQIKEVVDGPAKDPEGDIFFLVRIGENIYAFAFPGLNANIGVSM